MNLLGFSKLVVSLSRESPRLALVCVATSMLTAGLGFSIFYGSQHPEAMALVGCVYAVFAVAMFGMVRFALPHIKH
jgi:hypothetical protein